MMMTLTTRDFEHIQYALELAKTSQVGVKHSAVITRKNKIIAAETNRHKTHPIMLQYAPYTVTVHAEAAAIIRAKDVENCTLYSIRSLNGKLGNSRPCKHCAHFIVESGISIVVYVMDGVIYKERI